MKAKVYNFKNEAVGEIDLPENAFGVPWKPALVKQTVDAQLANRRRPWAHAKGRGEVRGGGRKPWRQKGTGRARHGSIRSPLWIGGGKAHGPTKNRDYAQKVNKKMKQLALASVLSRKLKDGEVKILESLRLEAPKTKLLAVNLRSFLALSKRQKKFDALLIPDCENKGVYRAAANLQKTKALHPHSLNVYDCLNYKHIIIDEKAVPAIRDHYQRTA